MSRIAELYENTMIDQAQAAASDALCTLDHEREDRSKLFRKITEARSIVFDLRVAVKFCGVQLSEDDRRRIADMADSLKSILEP